MTKFLHDLHHDLSRLVINFHGFESIAIIFNQVWPYNIIYILLKFASTMSICKFIIYEAHRTL